jgi:hypothetical protein
VAWSGFSWQNLQRAYGTTATFNQIPRNAGALLQAHIDAALMVGLQRCIGVCACFLCSHERLASAYIAMFDELDEGLQVCVVRCVLNQCNRHIQLQSSSAVQSSAVRRQQLFVLVDRRHEFEQRFLLGESWREFVRLFVSTHLLFVTHRR